MGLRPKRTEDRRIQKTRNLLHEALGSLILEKAYDSIAVQEILDRANVGRSTFYTHFQDKDELLVSLIHELLQSAYPAESRASGNRGEAILRFSLPVFEHIHAHLRRSAARMGTRGRAAVHHHLQKVLVERIGDEVTRSLKRGQRPGGGVQADLLVRYVASTFILVLEWWVEMKTPLSAVEVDRVFRTLVAPAVTASLGE